MYRFHKYSLILNSNATQRPVMCTWLTLAFLRNYSSSLAYQECPKVMPLYNESTSRNFSKGPRLRKINPPRIERIESGFIMNSHTLLYASRRLLTSAFQIEWKKTGPKPVDLTVTESARVSILMQLSHSSTAGNTHEQRSAGRLIRHH